MSHYILKLPLKFINYFFFHYFANKQINDRNKMNYSAEVINTSIH